MSWIRTVARRWVPAAGRRLVGRWLNALPQPNYAAMTNREIFSAVYRRGAWGHRDGRFYSGPGSEPELAGPYAALVKGLAARLNVSRVVDLGCGDFRVAQRFASSFAEYVGVDVVPELVAYNQKRYARDGVTFECRDICRDVLPRGDLCLVRQVLQHLPNAEIAALLPRLEQYRYVLVTEHLPAPGLLERPNMDKAPGPGVRVPLGSGVLLDVAPFNWHAGEVVWEHPLPSAHWHPGERLRATLHKIPLLPPSIVH